MDEELKSCPFCGKKAIKHETFWLAICTGCDTTLPIDLWQTRLGNQEEHKPITWKDGSQSCGSDCKICNCHEDKNARTVMVKYQCPRCGGSVGKPKEFRCTDESTVLEVLLQYYEFMGIPFPVDDKTLKFVKQFKGCQDEAGLVEALENLVNQTKMTEYNAHCFTAAREALARYKASRKEN